MFFPQRLLLITMSALILVSSHVQAQDNRYLNIQQASHISAGWVAFSNGGLYQCRFSSTNINAAPSCVLATGLPALTQRVSLLWAEGDTAWVSYTDGLVYGCRTLKNKAPVCSAASGLP